MENHVLATTPVSNGPAAETRFLYQMGRIFTSFTRIEDLLDGVLGLLRAHLSVRRGMISIRDRTTDDIFVDASVGYSDEEIRRGVYKPGEGITGRVVATGEPIVVPSIGNEPLFLNRTLARTPGDSDSMAFICVPIKIDVDTVGTISIDKTPGDDPSFARDLSVLTTTAIMIAHAVRSRGELRRRESQLEQENKLLELRLSERRRPANIIGNSAAMHELCEKILMVAPTASTVLVCGESGTGKELVANAIHENSPRKKGPYVRINVAALPESLIESELFGHEKGAFTGAAALKKGRFELAHGGTIFLDEIGDLARHLQVKLLRAIQEKSIERLGGEKTIPLDVRIIAATHRNLEEKMARGEFREDLYYRLNVFPLYVPPLRERKADVILLADHFLERFSRGHGKTIGRISSEAIDMLAAYHWPGNVRELENCVERAVIMSGEDVIRSYHLPPSLQMASPPAAPVTLEDMVDRYRREIIIDHLKMSRGNITRAAEMLGTTKRILTYTIHSLEIDYARYR
ncbi:MAG TPA: sigma 54-interacting transcriptional regulator [Spirochaetota bacterium]|nr:sigma 54-interacting transcriptional regulator [Spirochaetota bacterium]